MTQQMMTSTLTGKACRPCSRETAPVRGRSLLRLREQLNGNWEVVNDHHLEQSFTFNDFREALAFTNRVGEIAEKENHHPEILLTYGKVRLKLWTHNIDGLSENDFILAAKVDEARQTFR